MGESEFNKTRYTHRDYLTIKKDLISAIPSLTQEWTSREESDPGIVLIKLMSMLGDNLSYNIDKIALEMYLSTVTQRKNCAKILSLLGYKMHWYRSAKLILYLTNSNEVGSITVSPRTSSFVIGTRTYTAINPTSPTTNVVIPVGSTSSIYLVEGTYSSVNFTKESLDSNNRYYFNTPYVDESNIWLFVNGKLYGKLVDNLYLTTDDSYLYYEFNVDEEDRPYIELVNYWRDLGYVGGEDVTFTLGYIVTSGADGNVSPTTAVNSVSGVQGLAIDSTVFSHRGNIEESEIDTFNSKGYDYQTVDEARKDASNYVFTYDTLITSSDFEKATRRYPGITNSKLIDNEIIKNEDLDIEDILSRDPVISSGSGSLKPYSALIYMIYKDFNNNEYRVDSQDIDYDNPAHIMEGKEYYPYKPINSVVVSVDESLDNCKIMNVELKYGTTKVYPFRVSGEIHFISAMDPSDIVDIIDQIDIKLKSRYYPDNCSYGQKPNFMDIIDVIQGTDTRIRYFDAETNLINYTTTGTSEFDSTSFCKYQGLVKNDSEGSGFRIYKKFMKFDIKNNTSSRITELEAPEGNGQYENISSIVLEPRSTSEIVCSNIPQLRTLVYHINKGTISYVSEV